MVLENPAFFSSILALDLSRIPLSYGRIYITYHLIGRLFLPEISVAFTGMVIHSHVRFGYSLPSQHSYFFFLCVYSGWCFFVVVLFSVWFYPISGLYCCFFCLFFKAGQGVLIPHLGKHSIFFCQFLSDDQLLDKVTRRCNSQPLIALFIFNGECFYFFQNKDVGF